MASNKVSHLKHHPNHVLKTLRKLVQDLSRVDYSDNINELVQARKVSMRAIWTCLESGSFIREHLHINDDSTYAKLTCFVAGVQITVDVLMSEDSGENRLTILWADEIEEGGI